MMDNRPNKTVFFGWDEVEDAGRALTNVCHAAAYNGGWWHDTVTGEPHPDSDERFCTRLCLIHSEISEALEGRRKNKMDEHLPDRRNDEVELADAVIRIFDLAGGMGMDLGGAIAAKLAFNAQREDHKRENRIAAGGKAF